MRRVELELEHRYKNRFVGKHRIKPDKMLTVIGSSREADIRLLGEAVNGVHAVIEPENGAWTLRDVGSEQGTWIRKKPIVQHTVNNVTFVRIGGHQLRLIPKEMSKDLFLAHDSSTSQEGNKTIHQVVVRRHGVVLETFHLKAKQNYIYLQGEKTHTLKAPTSFEWTQHEFGDVEVRQRLIKSDKIEQTSADKVKGLMDPSLKGPAAGALALLLLIMGLVFFAPEKPENELVTPEMEQNRFTRMIYDTKQVRKKKKETAKLKKNIASHSRVKAPKRAGGGQAAKTKPSKQAGARVVKSIKAAGLGQLIGKISKRASKNAVFVQGSGKTADSKNTGKALGVAGGTTIGKPTKNATGGGHRIGGVSTSGKGGGSSAYKGIGGLAAGNVGNASVGVLEEETEIQGGLDREVIAQVIKSQLGQIRYCYERQLSANPDLYGKVKVKFTIGAAGSVVTQAINTTSLNNAMVEGCILRRVAGWQFPKPEGGTQVIVSYPFLFKSTR